MMCDHKETQPTPTIVGFTATETDGKDILYAMLSDGSCFYYPIWNAESEPYWIKLPTLPLEEL